MSLYVYLDKQQMKQGSKYYRYIHSGLVCYDRLNYNEGGSTSCGRFKKCSHNTPRDGNVYTI